MGGTFDPIHLGHLVAASEVQSQLALDHVVFVPTGQPWQKSDRAVSDAAHRLALTRLATESNEAFSVSRVDIDRDGPTYTIDTLRDLRRERPEAQMWFITGADALEQILTWKDVEQIWDLAQFVGVTRPGHVLSTAGLPTDRITLLEVPALAISSSDCRARVRRGAPIRYLVPDEVLDYVSTHQLYAEPHPEPTGSVIKGVS